MAKVSPDGVAPSRMVSVSASVNLPLHHKAQKFSTGTAHPGDPRKRAVKWLWWCGGTGKMCLGGGLHCPSAASCIFYEFDKVSKLSFHFSANCCITVMLHYSLH